MKTIKRVFALLIAIALAAGITVNADEARKREMRAAWVATVYCIDWPSTQGNVSAQKAEINTYLDNFKARNFNAIFFQVRSMCDAMYQSSYEPWSSYLTGTRGQNPGYDPLAYVVEQCHARGIQCHAWVNPYRWSANASVDWDTPQDKDLKNKGMLLSYTNSSGTKTTILNPGLPETRQRIVDVIEEIITNYDVDGIVFDDYFYPNGIPTNSSAEDYNLWNDSGVDMTFADWRRHNVNMMVRDVYNKIQEIKPEVRFGISPAGVAGTAATSAGSHGVTPCPKGSDWQYNGIFSDPLAWLEQGTIDYISPQIYWKTTHSSNPFGPLTDWWSYIAKHYGRHHYASHSISFFDQSNTTSDWAEVVKQINYSRQYTEDNCPGVVLYSARYIDGPRKTGLGAYLLANAFQYPALIPAVTWKTAPGYGAPEDLALSNGTLTWTPQQGTLVKYSVYAIPADITSGQAASTAFDGIRSEYLLDITYKPDYTLPSDYQEGYWYAVCVIDGYGNESEPAYFNGNDEPDPNQPTPVTYNIEKVWEINNLNFLTTSEARQGFGMNGKYYVNDKTASAILEIDRNGLTGTTFEGGRNVGFTRDEAGNFVVSDAEFPHPWNESSPSIKIIDPTTGQVTTHVLPADLTNFGRSDNFGFARGNLLEDGELYLVGVNSGTSISRIKFTDGELDTDNSYLANCDGVSPNSGTLLNYYTDLNGDDAILYVHRSNAARKLAFDGDNFTATEISLPNKGNCNGAFPFVWDNKELVVYPTMDNYYDGFAVAEINAPAPIAYVTQTVTTNANTYQADWLNAEVMDSRNVTIYQYYPGGHLTVWRLTKRGGYLRGDANADGTVNISDAILLINGLLNDDYMSVDLDNADVNYSNSVDISDATALINYLLNSTWPD